MNSLNVEIVGKIGSMALIDKSKKTIAYDVMERIGSELTPGMIWVTSGATEIGRLDFILRNGFELSGDEDIVKAEYASQGQCLLMKAYRDYIKSEYSVRQILVEHQHFNNKEKSKFLKQLIMSSIEHNAIPIINYNDAVSYEENRKNEIRLLEDSSLNNKIVECVDNDETAASICTLVGAKKLIIFTSADGIYKDPSDPKTLIETITGKDAKELKLNIDSSKANCFGASRKGSNGAKAKLEYIKEPALAGTEVIIANSRYSMSDVLSGKVPSTRIGLNL